ncbi:MAG: hypothetical protein KBT48_07750 [Firmicutes bacterium]|nr:hypothetical protein [Bacillota bacterium]
MIYEIKLGEAIGDIKIGMPRSEVKALFKNLKEWTELPYGYTHVIQYDINDDFQIVYDENNCVSFILCTSPEKTTLNGKSIGEYTYIDLLSEIQQLDDCLEEDGEGFVSNALGFGANIGMDDEKEYVESIQVAVKNFWESEG